MANEELKLENLSREQILDLADASGRKLGFLLATSGLDESAKAAIPGILEYATPAQIDALSHMLEEGYLRSTNQGLDQFLKSELGSIKAEFDQQRGYLEEEVQEKLNDLLKKLG